MKILISLFVCILSSLSVHASQVRVDVRGFADYTNQFGEILPDTPYSATFLYETNTALAVDSFDQQRGEDNLIYEFEGLPYFGSIIIGDENNSIFTGFFPGIFVGVTDGQIENQFIAALSPDIVLDRNMGFIEEGILIQILFEFTNRFDDVNSILAEPPTGSSFRFAFQETTRAAFRQTLFDTTPISVTFTQVPLPGTLLLFFSGILTFIKVSRRQTIRYMS